MDDKSTLFAALVCALAVVVVLIVEHRPSFFWWRYLFGLEKTSPDEMEWNEVVQRIRKRVYKAYKRHRKCLSNGIIATYGIEQYDDGVYREWLTLYPSVVTIPKSRSSSSTFKPVSPQLTSWVLKRTLTRTSG